MDTQLKLNGTVPFDTIHDSTGEASEQFPWVGISALLAAILVLEAVAAAGAPRHAGRALEQVDASSEKVVAGQRVRRQQAFASWMLVAYAASTIGVDCFSDFVWCAKLVGRGILTTTAGHEQR